MIRINTVVVALCAFGGVMTGLLLWYLAGQATLAALGWRARAPELRILRRARACLFFKGACRQGCLRPTCHAGAHRHVPLPLGQGGWPARPTGPVRPRRLRVNPPHRLRPKDSILSSVRDDKCNHQENKTVTPYSIQVNGSLNFEKL